MNEYTKSKVTLLVRITLVIVFILMVVLNHTPIGPINLLLQLVGVGGLIGVLAQYNISTK